MELYTFRLDAPDPTEAGTFEIQEVIEEYESLIWTERYYGDSECQITFPIKLDLLPKLPLDIFLGIRDSDELLILDTIQIENNRMVAKGISVLTWLNNRFIRRSKNHKVVTAKMTGSPGQILWEMLQGCVDVDSVWLTPDNSDIPQKYLDKLKIPEIGLDDFDDSDDPITVKVSFAALYDEMRRIAETHKLGMRIYFAAKTDPNAEFPLLYRNYKGEDRTHNQDPDDVQNDVVRFSAELNSLNNLRQLKSKAIYKTLAFAFASNIDYELGSDTGANAGVAFVDDSDDDEDQGTGSGFDCRAMQVFANIRGYDSPTDDDKDDLHHMLANFAKRELAKAHIIQAVDGDISPTNMFLYGRDYGLGDFVEIEGIDGVVSSTQVTEHIISEEASGETADVTLGSNAADVSV